MMTFILKKKAQSLWLLPTVTTSYLLIIPKSFCTCCTVQLLSFTVCAWNLTTWHLCMITLAQSLTLVLWLYSNSHSLLISVSFKKQKKRELRSHMTSQACELSKIKNWQICNFGKKAWWLLKDTPCLWTYSEHVVEGWRPASGHCSHKLQPLGTQLRWYEICPACGIKREATSQVPERWTANTPLSFSLHRFCRPPWAHLSNAGLSHISMGKYFIFKNNITSVYIYFYSSTSLYAGDN